MSRQLHLNVNLLHSGLYASAWRLLEQTHRAALLSAKAKIVADEFAIRGGNLLFDVGCASATRKITNFDRQWRNARTLSSARAIGQSEISDAPLPANGFF